MTVNMGSFDRFARAIAGIVLILVPLLTGFGAGSVILNWGAVVLGAVFLLTALLGFCPLYRLIGANTCAR